MNIKRLGIVWARYTLLFCLLTLAGVSSDYCSRFLIRFSIFLFQSSQDQNGHQQMKGNLGARCHVARGEHWALEFRLLCPDAGLC